jgi:hypothetical protein
MKILFLITMLSTTCAYAQTQQELVAITKQLEAIYITDQQPRIQLDSISERFGYNSEEVKKQWALIHTNDSINTLAVSAILDKYGWLSKEQTSEDANTTLFLVIQHADLAVQLKYKPILYEAVKQGKAKASHYALLLDRTNMHQDKLQVYGSQGSMAGNSKTYFFPIADEPNVNKKRLEIGLSPLEDYARLFDMNYTLPTVDTLKGKLVIAGFIIDQNQETLPDVNIYINGRLSGKTNQDGYYRFTTSFTNKFDTIVYKKEGFQQSAIPVEIEGKEVVYVINMLNKQL